MNMENLINAKIKELTDNGKLDEIITKEATNFITNVVSDVLGSWSDASKLFKEKLSASLKDKFGKMDFVSYSKSISDLIEAELNKTVIEIGIAPIKEMLKSFTGQLEKKEWKISEIISKFKDTVVIPNKRGESSGEISFIEETSTYGTIYIGFDEDANKDKRYQCKYQLMIDKRDNKLYSPTIQGKQVHPISENGGLYGFDLFLFKLYAMECKIECDINNVETEWSTFND